MPPELQQRVQVEVNLAKRRSGWPVERTLRALGVSRTTYYRWQRDEAWAKAATVKPPNPVQPYEALPEEKAAVKEYALKHPELRHRELAWRMVDEDVAYVSSSTVYRILREAKLVCPWSRRTKRRREEAEKASRANQIWATDIKYVWVGDRHYFLVCFLDEYSRYIVHHELLLGWTEERSAWRLRRRWKRCRKTLRAVFCRGRQFDRTMGAVTFRGSLAACWTSTS